jgi:hypothetical protein
MLELTKLREVSTIEEELERPRLEAWFVLMVSFTRFSKLSTLEEELERLKLEV